MLLRVKKEFGPPAYLEFDKDSPDMAVFVPYATTAPMTIRVGQHHEPIVWADKLDSDGHEISITVTGRGHHIVGRVVLYKDCWRSPHLIAHRIYSVIEASLVDYMERAGVVAPVNHEDLDFVVGEIIERIDWL